MLRRRDLMIGSVVMLVPGCMMAANKTPYDAVVAPPSRHDVPRRATLRNAWCGVFRSSRCLHPRRFGYGSARGDWREQLTLNKRDVHLTGEDRAQTRICFTAASGQKAPDGRNYGTYRTAVLKVTAPGFRARNLTYRERFRRYRRNAQDRPAAIVGRPGGAAGGGAVPVGKQR